MLRNLFGRKRRKKVHECSTLKTVSGEVALVREHLDEKDELTGSAILSLDRIAAGIGLRTPPQRGENHAAEEEIKAAKA